MKASKSQFDTTQSHEHVRVLEIINEMISAVGYAMDVTEIYEVALRGLMQALPIDRAAILRREPNGHQQFEAWYGLSDGYREAVAGHSPWTSDDPDPQPISIEDVLEDRDIEPFRETIAAEGIRALAFIPLLHQGELLGKFMLYYNEPHLFSDEEIELARMIAGQVALAVARSRSEQQLQAAYDELEQRTAEHTAQLEEQIRQRERAQERLSEESALVRLLQEIAAFANEADSFEEAVHFTLAKVCAYAHWPIGHVYVLDDEAGGPTSSGLWFCREPERFAAFRDVTEKTAQSVADDWIRAVFENGGVNYLHDVSESAYIRHKAAKNSGLVSCFAVPVVVDSQVIAVLEFFSPQAIEVSDSLLEAMNFVATQLARIVEREHASNALRDSEQRFRAIFNQTFQFIGLCRPDGTLIEANQTALAFGGLERDEVVGKPFWETHWWALSPEIQEQLRTAMQKAASGQFVRYEVEVLGKENSTAVIDFSLKPVVNNDGEVVLIIPEGRVITQLKQALDRLQRSETMLTEAQRLAHIGSWEWNATENILTWSDELFHIFGVDPDHFVPTFEAMAELIHPDDLETWLLRNRSTVEPLEDYVRIIRPDGELRILHARTTPIFDQNGRRIKLFGTIQDSTEQRQTEEALRRSERLLVEAQSVARLGSWEWDLSKDQLTWSQELYHIYGLQPGEFEPTYDKFLQLVHPEDRHMVDTVVRESLETQEPFEFYHRVVRPDGVVRILNALGKPILIEEGEIVRMYGTGQDVTEQKQTEEALRKSEESYRTLARNIPDAMVALYDRDLRLILVEGDIPRSVRAGMALTDLLPHGKSEEYIQPYVDALHGTPQSFEIEYENRIYTVQTVPVSDEDGEIFAGIAMAQDITERKITERKLELRAQQLAALHEIGQTVAGTLDLDTIFKRVLDNLRPLLNAEGVFILLREGKGQLVFAAANEVGVGKLTGLRVSEAEGVAGQVLRTGEIQFFSGDETVKRTYHELEEVAHYHPRAIIAVPLQLHGELIGVMEAVDTDPEALAEDDKAIIQTAANWTAIAIGNARQHGRLQRRLGESEALAGISRALSETLDLERVLQLIVEAAQQLIPHVDWAAIHFLQKEAEQEQLYPVAIAGSEANGDTYLIQPELAEEREKSLLRLSPANEAFLEILSNDMIANPSLPAADVPSLLVVSIESREEKSGTLSVQSALPDAFSEEDEKLLTMLGRQAAVAIENARLFKAQQEARQTAETLRTVNVILSQTLDLHTILETLLNYAHELIGFERALVMLLQRGGQLRIRAQRGFDQLNWGQQLVNVDDVSIFRRLLDEKTSIIINDIDDEIYWIKLSDVEPLHGSWLTVPLLTGEKAVGIFVLYHSKTNFYNDRSAMLAEALSAQASIAIQNARLFAQVQAGQERLRLLSKQVVSAQEEERQRVSRELHDEAGQALTALKISLEMIRATWSTMPPLVAKQMNEAIAMTDQTMEQIRLLAHDLRPPVLDTFGLGTTLEGLVRDFGRRANLEIEFEGMPIPEMPEAVTISFYRFVQEALTNVAKHADASEVKVELHNDGDKIMVAVTDDGKGFNVEEKVNAEERKGGIGLMGMQDRFDLLSGWIEIDSAPGQGTRVVAYVPYREEQ